jgi:hypothetical protein
MLVISIPGLKTVYQSSKASDTVYTTLQKLKERTEEEKERQKYRGEKTEKERKEYKKVIAMLSPYL